METPKEYFEKLEKIREEKSMNIVDFAEKELGMSKATYYRWKNGKVPNSIEFYQRIEEYLKNYNL